MSPTWIAPAPSTSACSASSASCMTAACAPSACRAARCCCCSSHGSTNEPAPVPGGFIPPHHGSGELHLCFAIPFGELAAWEEHLQRAGHRGGKPHPLAARRHQPVFPRSRRQFAGGRHAGALAESLNDRTLVRCSASLTRGRAAAAAGAWRRGAALAHARRGRCRRAISRPSASSRPAIWRWRSARCRACRSTAPASRWSAPA